MSAPPSVSTWAACEPLFHPLAEAGPQPLSFTSLAGSQCCRPAGLPPRFGIRASLVFPPSQALSSTLLAHPTHPPIFHPWNCPPSPVPASVTSQSGSFQTWNKAEMARALQGHVQSFLQFCACICSPLEYLSGNTLAFISLILWVLELLSPVWHRLLELKS